MLERGKFHTHLQEGGKEGQGQPATHILVPGKVMEQILLKVISMHEEDKKLTGSSQHRFNKDKTYSPTLLLSVAM